MGGGERIKGEGAKWEGSTAKNGGLGNKGGASERGEKEEEASNTGKEMRRLALRVGRGRAKVENGTSKAEFSVTRMLERLTRSVEYGISTRIGAYQSKVATTGINKGRLAASRGMPDEE